MAKRAVKKLNNFTKPPKPEMPMTAPNWDDPNTQMARIVTRRQQPRLLTRGPSGITKRS